MPVGLKDVASFTFIQVLSWVMMQPLLICPAACRTVDTIDIVILFDLLCSASLSFLYRERHPAIVKLVVAHDKASTLIAVDALYCRRVIKNVIFDKDKFFGTPIWIVGPRAITVISPIPRIVAECGWVAGPRD